MVLDAVVEGRTISSVGCNATEFGLYLFYVQPEGPSVELRQRMLNLQDSDVKEELRGRWNTGNLILKNKSLKDLIEQKDMAKDLAAYMKRLKELDKDGTADELLDWLREAYGVEGTAVAMFDPLKTLNKTKLALKPLLEWFRNEASVLFVRSDPARHQIDISSVMFPCATIPEWHACKGAPSSQSVHACKDALSDEESCKSVQACKDARSHGRKHLLFIIVQCPCYDLNCSL